MRKNTLVGFLAIALAICLIFAVRGWDTCGNNMTWLHSHKYEKIISSQNIIGDTASELQLWFCINFLPDSWWTHTSTPLLTDQDLLENCELARLAGMSDVSELAAHPVSIQVEAYFALLLLTAALTIALILTAQRKNKEPEKT